MLAKGVCAMMMASIAVSALANAQQPSVKIAVNKRSTGMGQGIELYAKATLPDGKPAVGWTILPYVNGQRWGAHEIADKAGKAVFQIPLPRVGQQIVTASVLPSVKDVSQWIWAFTTSDQQVLTLRRSFQIKGKPTGAQIWLAVDDIAKLSINGKPVGDWAGWLGDKMKRVPAGILVSGENKIEATATNGSGPAGFLFRMEVATDLGTVSVGSDSSWTAQQEGKPIEPVEETGAPKVVQPALDQWPIDAHLAQMYTSTVMAPDQPVSNQIIVDVKFRKLQAPPKNPKSLVVMQYEEWFSPTIYNWGTAQAVPLMGFYRCSDENVLRQHIIWMIEAGTDIIQCDMSNNIWFTDDWNNVSGIVRELLFINELMMETLAKMRDEGIDVPKFMILSGVSWTPNGLQVVNHQLNALYQLYINNPRYGDIYYKLDGKPVVLLLDLPGRFHPQLKDIDNRWNIRFASVNMETNVEQREKGFWSWMDNEATSVPGPDGKPESITASVGCFNGGGWKDPGSRGRRGGATLVEDWQAVLRDRPKHVFIHQFQEFAGQLESQGRGPNRDIFGDSYSVDLSDDIEPTSLTKTAYRGNGGWGYFYLNLNKALMDMLRQKTPETTVLVVAKPDRRHEVSGNSMELQWRSVGKSLADGVTVVLDGKVVKSGLMEQSTILDISKLKPGLHTITLTAPGAMQRYRLSWTDDSLPLSSLEPSTVIMEFIKTQPGLKEKSTNAQ